MTAKHHYLATMPGKVRAVTQLFFFPASWVLTGLLLIHGPTQALELPGYFGELLLFPTLQFQHRTRSRDKPGIPKNKINPAIDLFYTARIKNFLILAELPLSRKHQDFARLQIGWKLQPDSRLWFGRYHNPFGYWNERYHHGLYMQTTIKRPGIAEFERKGGPTPIHITGLLYEKTILTDRHLIDINLGLGFGPSLEAKKFKPMEVFDPGDGTHRLNVLGRIVFQSDPLVENKIGVFSGYTRIDSNRQSLKLVKQIQAGVFARWQPTAIKLTIIIISISRLC